MLVSISEVFAEVCKESWVSMFALSLSKEKEKHGKEDFLSVSLWMTWKFHLDRSLPSAGYWLMAINDSYTPKYNAISLFMLK